MTQEKLDLQRDVVRNERRQTSEIEPYGIAGLTLPGAVYPPDHPYHHTVIGSHEDLEAATVQDVVDFFHRFYVPGNATLVVAGDFDAATVKPLIESTFGAVEVAPVPEPKTARPVVLSGEKRVVVEDAVQFPRLYLAWPSPPFFKEGDAEMDLTAALLSDGPSSRLTRRLVYEEGLAQDVVAYQSSGELGSEFMVVATAASPDGDLDAIKTVILEEVDKLKRFGPDDAELTRVKTTMEAGFLKGLEGLLNRAEALNRYHHYFGEANSFSSDLDRWRKSTPERISSVIDRYLGEGRVDLRVNPESDAPKAVSPLDERPGDLASSTFRPPVPEEFNLSNGIRVLLVPRLGNGLFAGELLCEGGESLISPDQAGLATLYANLAESGAGGLDASTFAAKISSLGGSLGASASATTFEVSVEGIASQRDPILDLFADMVLRPNLTDEDFEREQDLQLAAIGARSDDPNALARSLGSLRTFG
ncbi:MAG: insulinase family protein, partial [Planctomycetota bacterium]